MAQATSVRKSSSIHISCLDEGGDAELMTPPFFLGVFPSKSDDYHPNPGFSSSSGGGWPWALSEIVIILQVQTFFWAVVNHGVIIPGEGIQISGGGWVCGVVCDSRSSSACLALILYDIILYHHPSSLPIYI